METAINERQLKRARIEWNSFQSIPAFRSTDCPFILVKRQFEEIACLLLVFAVKILSGFQIGIKMNLRSNASQRDIIYII